MIILPPITPVEPNHNILRLTNEEKEFIAKPPITVVKTYDDVCQACSYVVLQSVFHGSHVFDRCSQQKHKTLSLVVVPLILRNVLEEGQAAALLIRSHLCSPAWIICRTLLEAYYSVSFLLESGTVDEERANAFIAWTRCEALEALKVIENGVQNVKLKPDPNQPHSNEEQRKNIEAELKDPRYSKYAAVYKKGRTWYRLYSNKLEKPSHLAAYFGIKDEHAVLYKYASAKAHAEDPFRAWVQGTTDKTAGVYTTRKPETSMPKLAVLAASMINGVLHKAAHAYLKQDIPFMTILAAQFSQQAAYMDALKQIRFTQ